MRPLTRALAAACVAIFCGQALAAPKPDHLKHLVLSSLASERHFDAQHLALTGLALFADDPESRARFTLWRAHALWKLGDTTEAYRLLASDDTFRGLSPDLRRKVEFYERWIHLKSGDRDHFERWLARAPGELQRRGRFYLEIRNAPAPETLDALALSGANRTGLQAALDEYKQAPQQSPAFNAVLSGVLPGAGHARLGRWQDAALTFALNAISISATVELARKDLAMPAVAAGAFASLFYVGGISSAWRLTKERNEQAREKPLQKIENALFEELKLDF
ncbi:MAG TPA: hypothetical protein VFV50_08615 [Bdellovibrionales bacterium]|nr:hypothetical protein [Bdellovibrionales bacterium]